MIAVSYTVISAALDIISLMLLRIVLKPVIGNGTAYLSLAEVILLLFYASVALPVRLSVSRESVKTANRGGDIGAALKPGVLISIPAGLLSGLLLLILSELISGLLLSEPYLFLSLAAISPGVAFLIISSAFSGVYDAVSAAGSFALRSILRIGLIIAPSYLGTIIGKNYGQSIALILLNEKEGEVIGSAGAMLGLSFGFLIIMIATVILTPIRLRKVDKKGSVTMDTAGISPMPSIVSTVIPEAVVGLSFMACVVLGIARCERLENTDIAVLTRIFTGTDSIVLICVSLAAGVSVLFLPRPLDTLLGGEKKKYRARLSRSVRYAVAFSLPFAAFAGALLTPLHNSITGLRDVPGYLSVMSALAVPCSSVFVLLFLASFEEMAYLRGVFACLAGSLISLFASITAMGRQGNAYGVMLVILLAPVLSAVAMVLLKHTSGRDRIRLGDIVSPLIAGVILTLISFVLRLLIEYLAGSLTAAIICTVLIYFLWIILMRIFGILNMTVLGRLPGGGIASIFGGDR